MASEDEAVAAATREFFGAIEDIVSGRGVERMKAAWHQLPNVTSAHPLGNWANGWSEVLATWQVFASFGRPGNAGTRLRDLRVFVFGDTAYATSVFTSSPSLGSIDLNCTDVLRRIDGAWKVVHHHADKAPELGERLQAQLAAES